MHAPAGFASTLTQTVSGQQVSTSRQASPAALHCVVRQYAAGRHARCPVSRSAPQQRVVGHSESWVQVAAHSDRVSLIGAHA